MHNGHFLYFVASYIGQPFFQHCQEGNTLSYRSFEQATVIKKKNSLPVHVSLTMYIHQPFCHYMRNELSSHTTQFNIIHYSSVQPLFDE